MIGLLLVGECWKEVNSDDMLSALFFMFELLMTKELLADI